MKNVIPWPHAGGPMAPLPKPITRPCDWGLLNAVQALETQLGTIEAYNRLVRAAEELRAQIERGEAKAQNPIYARRPRG
jgi:hypothetical protein